MSKLSGENIAEHKLAKSLIVILVMSFLLFSAEVQAQKPPSPPPISNHGELITVPTARIMGSRGRVGAEYIQQRSRIYGVFRLENIFELGGQVQGVPAQEGDLGLLLKARIVSEDETSPAFSAGIRGTSPYFAASKYLGHNFNIHFGIGDTQPDGLFIALNSVFNPEVEGIAYIEEDDDTVLPRTNVMLEFNGGDINVGARTMLAPELTVELSLLNMESVKAGMGFNF